MIIEHEVIVRHEHDDMDEIEALCEGKYVKFVRKRICEMLRDEFGCFVCSECGEDLPAWVTRYPADYCPCCGAKVVN